jgi:hypothetical protein
MKGEQPSWVDPSIGLFVSFARSQEDVARTVVGFLEERGQYVWADFKEIGRIEHWWEEAKPHIERCDVFLAVVSPDYYASADCSRELSYASSQACLVVAALWTEPQEWDRKKTRFHAVVPLGEDGSLDWFDN